MKKRYLIFLSFIFLLMPFNIKAYDYGISDYYVEATVEDNGDITVKELFSLEGSYNGMERIIDYKNQLAPTFDPNATNFGGSNLHNGDDLVLTSIKGIDKENISFDSINANGDLFTSVDSASKGDYGKYVETIRSNGKSFLMYNPNKKDKAFYLEYTIKNMAILHNDIGELGWTFFGTELNESIGHLEVVINIPNNQNTLRAWAHGPLYGESKLVGNNQVVFTIDGLDANTAIDFRVAFDKEVIINSPKLSNTDALNKIINYETVLADQANLEREQEMLNNERYAEEALTQAEASKKREDYDLAEKYINYIPNKSEKKAGYLERLAALDIEITKIEKRNNIIYNSLYAIYLVGLILLIRHIYLKYDKEYKSDFNHKYYRDFPEEYGPEIVGYLINRRIGTDDLSAAIANLIYKKVIIAEKIPNSKNDYKLIYSKESPEDKDLIDFLFEDDKKETTLNELKKRANKRYESFIEKFTNWKDKALKKALEYNFFESTSKGVGKGILYIIIGILLAALTMESVTNKTLGYILVVLSIVAVIYLFTITKRTKKGNEDYKKWMALKHFMEDFGRMDTKELPEIVLWEKYLVYAISLGCADKLAKTMEIKVQELQKSGYMGTTYDYTYYHSMVMFNRSINRTVSSAVSSAYSSRSAAEAARISNSSSSSGGGFGGGFSGGGGSFGGGGGGGRF